MYDVPICLFIFKRIEKSVQIIKKISMIKPTRLYLVSDGGRTKEEIELVEECRRQVENSIDWPCEVVKMYNDENKGCHNIGMAALNIFSHESMCVFLEDDNEPADTFFDYCKELLNQYKDDDRVLWICGTNYLTEYQTEDESDYVFTQHMLPCGWASWGEKFRKYYDYDFQNLTNEGVQVAKKNYKSNRLFRYDKGHWFGEIENKRKGRYSSWDYHMNFSLRYYNKLGIAPRYNQITNIGVDLFSEHGGISMENPLTNKFCEVPTKRLTFPLKHPKQVAVDERFEKITEGIILPPRSFVVKSFIRRLIPLPQDISIKKSLKERRIVRM